MRGSGGLLLLGRMPAWAWCGPHRAIGVPQGSCCDSSSPCILIHPERTLPAFPRAGRDRGQWEHLEVRDE